MSHASQTLTELSNEIHNVAREHGWWGNNERASKTALPGDRNRGETLMLIVSEAGEAMEAAREPDFDPMLILCGTCKAIAESKEGITQEVTSEFVPSCSDSNHKPIGYATELADILIRVGDLAAAEGIDLERITRLKMAYNRTRPFRHGGKTS